MSLTREQLIAGLELELDSRLEESFTPYKISKEYMPLIFRDVPESVKVYARNLRDKGWKFYSVAQDRGRCYYGVKTITIPVWAIKRPLDYKIWYISHELAHVYDDMRSNHGDPFMQKLIEICPPECIKYELGYKPRNARRNNITVHGVQKKEVFDPDLL